MKHFAIAAAMMLCAAFSAAAQGKFPMITIPEEITEPMARAKYLGEHFWDNADFAVLDDAAVEEGIAEMVSVMSIVDYETMNASWAAAVKRAEAEKGGVARLLAAGDKLLNDVSAPSYNEPNYRALLQTALVSKKISKADKAPYQKQLVMLEVNNVGEQATDFEFEKADGGTMKLSETAFPVTVLFMYDPAGIDSKLERYRLSQARLVNYLMRAGGLGVVAVYPSADTAVWEKHKGEIPSEWISGRDAAGAIEAEGLYDLRVKPRFYLLDEDKSVLLKNTTTEEIENYLYQVIRSAAEQQKSAEGQDAAAEAQAETQGK